MVAKSKQAVVSTGRIEAFSDAVFSIAGTLLALQLVLPPGFPTNPTDHQLIKALMDQGPSYFAFILSFLVIGRYWIAHHQLFSRIERSTSGLAMLNLLLLLTVVAIPYPTQLLGSYRDLAAAAIFYAVSLSLVGLMMFVIWRYAARHKLLYSDVSAKDLKLSEKRSLAVPIVFLLSIPIAFYNVDFAEYFWLLSFAAGYSIRKK
ncbi:DUF1211 domain-containing protein [Patescibacteria group bacterium]|nr:DUF1211 domain-containing protein [Patescibacteria group bacterium]